MTDKANTRIRIAAIVFFFCTLICAQSAVARASRSQKKTEPRAEAVLIDKLLHAIRTNDYNSFVADGAPKFKQGLTKSIFEKVTSRFAPRLKQGYSKSYLGFLNQQGFRIYLYKLTFIGVGDDVLVKMVIKDGQVAGFWLY